ncbi:hypothetical protein AYO40_06160 [Planctomycetaceae bacterium SCGC AG-212-D15]|nr:hypothetical protein AYO40_06160 [Planctomycetaceae bacterium SCGC AG-212-D15]
MSMKRVLLAILTALAISTMNMPVPAKDGDGTEAKLPALLSAKPLRVDPKDDEMRKLLKARYNEAVSYGKAYYIMRSNPEANFAPDQDGFYALWKRIVDAGLDLCDAPPEKVKLFSQYVEVAREAEALEKARHEAGRVPASDFHRARYERIDAEVRLLRAKREMERGKDK